MNGPVTRAGRVRLAWSLLGLGALVCLVYVGSLALGIIAAPGGVESVIYLAAAAIGLSMSVTGAFLVRGPRRRIWVIIAVGQGVYWVGDLLWVFYEQVWHIAPYPSVADVAYLARYPLVALGLLWLVRGRRVGRDRAALLDAAIITTGVSVVGTVFVIAPAAADGGATLLSQVVAAAYPACDLLLFALLVRLLTTGAARSLSFWSLVSGLGVLMVADVQYVLSVVSGAWFPDWFNILWVMSYLLIGFAAVHPSVDTLSEPVPHRPERMTRTRLVALGVALLLAPLTYQAQDISGDDKATLVVLAGSVVSVGLVLARMWDLLEALQAQAVQLSALARRDSLTGVANRRTWDHEFSRACAAAREEGKPLAVAVMDLDHFKEFNDAHGHIAGDEVLKETAAAWTERLNGRGFLARYGGEEFTVLLPHTPAEIAQLICDELRTSVAQGQTCSVGLAMWNEREEPAGLLTRADLALYQAKRGGRNRVAVHDGTTVRSPERQSAQALATSLRTVFQPIVDLDTGQTYAFEALSRFEGADPPTVFANAAQRGHGPQLEALAIRNALEVWDRPETLSVNVSVSALLSDEVREVLPADLSGLVIEITEHEFAHDQPALLPTVAELRARGARIAVDDVGVGASNADRLVTVQPEIIKMDMSLVRDIDHKPARQTMMRLAVQFAREIGGVVCAEGVETGAELATLRELGVTLAQGYHIGYPGPPPTPSIPSPRRPMQHVPARP